MFGLVKCKACLPHGLEVDSHWDDHVNFSHPKMVNAIVTINYLLATDARKLMAFCLLSLTMMQRSLSAFVVNAFNELNDAPPSLTLTAHRCKKKQNITR